ncbi:MAG: hypothetical protein GY756_10525, partial [bacterium]|nr:hypothetical protein [bacterium]
GIYETIYFRKKTKFIPWSSIKELETNAFEFSFGAKIKFVLKEYEEVDNFSIPLYAINRLVDTINQAIKKSDTLVSPSVIPI